MFLLKLLEDFDAADDWRKGRRRIVEERRRTNRLRSSWRPNYAYLRCPLWGAGNSPYYRPARADHGLYGRWVCPRGREAGRGAGRARAGGAECLGSMGY